ncbi:MAG: hypothetical protein ACRDPT_06045 [Streptomycetales bacterium]
MTGVPPVAVAAVGRPAAHLVPWVRRYLGYRYEGFAPGVYLGAPSRHLTVVISLGAPTRMAAMPDPRQAPGASVQAALAAREAG